MKEQLLKLLNHKGYTAARLADEIGVQRSGISHILSGRNQPSYDFIIKILDRFPDIDTEWLLLGKGEMIKHTFRDIPKQSVAKITNVNKIDQIIVLYTNGTCKQYTPDKKD
ncbi:MAG TPA: helix-turn-helix transcriptional regulator [Bacteroidales bacterium]|nr:helix-turn-helix transcriptional regulator [Bacteroidales bacterium]